MTSTFRNSCKRLKTLKHPSILTYIASVETDKVRFYCKSIFFCLHKFVVLWKSLMVDFFPDAQQSYKMFWFIKDIFYKVCSYSMTALSLPIV